MNRRIIILVGLLNIIIALGYFVSCQSDPRKLPERVNVAGLGKQIGDRSELQKEIADEAKKKAPEVEDDMENIKDLADGNIEDSNKIILLQTFKTFDCYILFLLALVKLELYGFGKVLLSILNPWSSVR